MESSLQHQSPTVPANSNAPADNKDRRPSTTSESSSSSNITKSSPPSSAPHDSRPLLFQLFGGRNSRTTYNTSTNENSHSSSSNDDKPKKPKSPTTTASSPTRRRGLIGDHLQKMAARQLEKDSKLSKSPVVRIGADEELLKRRRRWLDHYVRRLGALMGREVGLNDKGMAFFSFQKKFVVVIEVPEDNCNTLYVYTMVCRADRNTSAICKRAMELNYMQYGTVGATLGLHGDEVNYCFTCQFAHMTFDNFRTSMETFLLTALEIHKELEAIKQQKVHF